MSARYTHRWSKTTDMNGETYCVQQSSTVQQTFAFGQSLMFRVPVKGAMTNLNILNTCHVRHRRAQNIAKLSRNLKAFGLSSVWWHSDRLGLDFSVGTATGSVWVLVLAQRPARFGFSADPWMLVARRRRCSQSATMQATLMVNAF